MWELCRSRSDIHCFDVLKVCPHFPPFRDRAPYFALVTSLNKSWMRVRWLPQCNDKEVIDKSQGAYITSWLTENDIFRRVQGRVCGGHMLIKGELRKLEPGGRLWLRKDR